MFPIESNVPIPSYKTKPTPYPFSEMKVGQSIFVPADKAGAARTAAAYYGKTSGTSFVSRKATKDGVEGVRIWRAA